MGYLGMVRFDAGLVRGRCAGGGPRMFGLSFRFGCFAPSSPPPPFLILSPPLSPILGRCGQVPSGAFDLVVSAGELSPIPGLQGPGLLAAKARPLQRVRTKCTAALRF